MKQPGIIIIGNQFFLKIESLTVHFVEMSSIETTIGCLVAIYYILNIKYPSPLKLPFLFFEYLFEFTEFSSNSAVVKKKFTKVMPGDPKS